MEIKSKPKDYESMNVIIFLWKTENRESGLAFLTSLSYLPGNFLTLFSMTRILLWKFI